MQLNVLRAGFRTLLVAATTSATACSGVAGLPPGTGAGVEGDAARVAAPATRDGGRAITHRQVQATTTCPTSFFRRPDAPTADLGLAPGLPGGPATRLNFQAWRPDGGVPDAAKVYYRDGKPFTLLVSAGPRFTVEDADARDGTAVVTWPGTARVFLTAEGKPGGAVGFADPLYFTAGTLTRSTGKPQVWQLGTRSASVPEILGAYRWELAPAGMQPGFAALLYPADAPPPSLPLPPTIGALSAPDETSPGGTATIQATVAGDALAYRWSASAGSISGESMATWAAPRQAGIYDIALAVETLYYRSETCALAIRVPEVCPAATVTGEDGAPVPAMLEAGKTLALRAAGTDENGDALSFRWEASAGALSSLGGPSTSWTAPGTEGPATVTAIVSDGICETPAAVAIEVKDDNTPTSFAYTSPINIKRLSAAGAGSATHVYLAGGVDYDGTGPVYDVEFAPIAPDGSLGAWQVTSRLNVARQAPSAFIAQGYLYVAGGHTMQPGYPFSAIGYASHLERAHISPDGSLGAFELLNDTWLEHVLANAVVSEGALYIIGGGRHDAPYTAPERAFIGPDGSVGPFQALRDLSPSVTYATGAMVERTLITLGGHQIAGLATADRPVRWTRLTPAGDLEAWRSALLVHPRHFGMAHGHGKHVYALGGRDPERIEGTNGPIAVERAVIDETGALGAFQDVPGVVLNVPRYLAAGVSAGKRFYAIGGRRMDDNRFPMTPSVEYARLP